jgi:integrase
VRQGCLDQPCVSGVRRYGRARREAVHCPVVGGEDGRRRARRSHHRERLRCAASGDGRGLEDNRIARNPCDGVKLPKRQHADRGYLTHAQVAALACTVEYRPEVVRFLAYTGLRWGEMSALRVGDFDMLRRRVNVSRSVTEFNGLVWSTPKSWERRSVPFPASLADELAALMVGKGRDALMFTTTRGDVLRVSNYRKRFFAPAVAACQKADESFPTRPTTSGIRQPAWRSVPGPT